MDLLSVTSLTWLHQLEGFYLFINFGGHDKGEVEKDASLEAIIFAANFLLVTFLDQNSLIVKGFLF